jgi:hypothetical protein
MQVNRGVISSLIVVMTLAGCSNSGSKPEASTSTGPSPAIESTKQASEENTDASQPSSSSEVYEGTIHGVISDSMCGKDHLKMGETGKDPAKCIEQCVASGAKYVLVDEKGDSYTLSDQEKSKILGGKHVAISGHIDPTEKAIHVHSIVTQ